MYNYLKPTEIIVDRVYDNFIVVEVDKGEVKILRSDYLLSIKEGDVLKIDSKGKIVVDKVKTKKRKKKIKELTDKVFKN